MENREQLTTKILYMNYIKIWTYKSVLAEPEQLLPKNLVACQSVNSCNTKFKESTEDHASVEGYLQILKWSLLEAKDRIMDGKKSKLDIEKYGHRMAMLIPLVNGINFAKRRNWETKARRYTKKHTLRLGKLLNKSNEK